MIKLYRRTKNLKLTQAIPGHANNIKQQWVKGAKQTLFISKKCLGSVAQSVEEKLIVPPTLIPTGV